MQQFQELTLTMLMLLGDYQDHHGPSECPTHEFPIISIVEKSKSKFKPRPITRSVSAPAGLCSLKDPQPEIEIDSAE